MVQNNQKHTLMNLEIDRLVIEGIIMTGHQQRLLKRAVQTSLKDLFAERGIPEGMSSVSSTARVQGETIRISAPETEPAHLGRQIATSIYGGLCKQL